jgi:hypothetical protein
MEADVPGVEDAALPLFIVEPSFVVDPLSIVELPPSVGAAGVALGLVAPGVVVSCCVEGVPPGLVVVFWAAAARGNAAVRSSTERICVFMIGFLPRLITGFVNLRDG